jgi:hypothetical protein
MDIMNKRNIIIALTFYGAVVTAIAFAYYQKYTKAKAKVNTKCAAVVNSANKALNELDKVNANEGVLASTKKTLNDIISYGVSAMLVESDEDKEACIVGVNKFCEKKVNFMPDQYDGDQATCVETELRMCGANGIEASRFAECGIIEDENEFMECHKNNLTKTIRRGDLLT